MCLQETLQQNLSAEGDCSRIWMQKKIAVEYISRRIMQQNVSAEGYWSRKYSSAGESSLIYLHVENSRMCLQSKIVESSAGECTFNVYAGGEQQNMSADGKCSRLYLQAKSGMQSSTGECSKVCLQTDNVIQCNLLKDNLLKCSHKTESLVGCQLKKDSLGKYIC